MHALDALGTGLEGDDLKKDGSAYVGTPLADEAVRRKVGTLEEGQNVVM